MSSRKLWLILFTSLLSAGLVLAGCSKERKSSGGESEGGGGEENGEPEPVELDENGNVIDSGGTKVDLAHLEKRTGVDPKSTTPAAGDGKGAPPDNWIYDGATGNGHFFVAGSSAPNSAGGDILRRIDLDGEVTEFDFNDQLPGVQGLFIEVPSALTTNWKQVGQQSDFASGLFAGTICGLIPGPDKKVIALVRHGALVLDLGSEGQAVTPEQTIFFPGGIDVCNGVYSRQFNKLYAFNTAAVEKRGGQEGLYVSDIGSGSVTADLYMQPEDYGFNAHSSNSFDDVALYDNTLYFSEDGARFSASYDVGVHKVPLSDEGDPLFDKATLWRTENPVTRTESCPLSPDNSAGVEVVKLGGKPVLLVGGTAGVMAYDLTADPPSVMDLDARRPGTQPLDLSDYGRGGTVISYGPDGGSVYVLTHCKTAGVYAEIDDTYGRVEKHEVAVLDVSGDAPTASGIDAGHVALQLSMASGLKPSYMPKFVMSLRDMGVGSGHVGIVGAGKSGSSGLGNGSDMIIIDRISGQTLSFQKSPDAKTAHRLNYGFKLAQDDPEFGDLSQSVHAIIWTP